MDVLAQTIVKQAEWAAHIELHVTLVHLIAALASSCQIQHHSLLDVSVSYVRVTRLQGKEFIADNKEAQSTTLAANVSSVNEELRGIIDSLHTGELVLLGVAGRFCWLQAACFAPCNGRLLHHSSCILESAHLLLPSIMP
jgi:hypothetical protein